MLYRWNFLSAGIAAALLLAGLAGAGPFGGRARAADILGPAPSGLFAPTATTAMIDPYRAEVRVGGFAHGVGSVESGTFDLNGELVLPRLPFGQGEWWSFLVPRPHIGGIANLDNRSSYVYGGALWTVPLVYGFFWEAFFGGAAHNGSLNGTFDHVALGCQPLFHVGGSLGYTVTQNLHVMFTIDHVSNGNEVFGTDCNRNQGLNNYGLRLGYSF
jgi:lipid A 3-O-deacylase